MADSAPSKPFVHLHVHSQYSLLDGACRIKDMVNRAKQLDQPSLAITDHGCLFGAIDFYNAAHEAGVKPIVGIEAYMASGDRRDKTATGVKDGGYHLLLLAQNHTGYKNLLKLGSIAYTEGFYYKPRIDKEVLREHSEGLICTSACLGGEIPTALRADDRKKAKEIAETYLDVFGPDRFFIELQQHIREQNEVNPHLMDLADTLGIGAVATNDVHFLLKEDHAPHDCLCCISTGKLVSDESRLIYPTQLYLKSTDEMYRASDEARWQAACENTARIAEMCELELDFSANHAPVVKIETAEAHGSQSVGFENASEHPVGSTEWFKDVCAQFKLQPFDETRDKNLSAEELKKQCDDALRQLCEAGLIWRYGPPEDGGITQEHRDRLERELKILADKSISAYFLIVWDFVNEARRRGIPCNARGSGVGTMVGYVLGLSNACPVRFGLLFERFTDPDRSEYPDIDIDLCQDGRQEIIEYVRQKYGYVAQIITFNYLKAKAAVRDVGRVLNIPLPEVDKVCKLIGDGLGVTLDQALDQEPDLRELYEKSNDHRQMIDTARRLEGLARHAGIHAAAVVMATQPLDNIVPLYKPSSSGNGGESEQLVTQWDGPTCEMVGLLKMDFLGLRTLSIIERAKSLVRQTLDDETIRKSVEGSGASGLGSGQTRGAENDTPDPRPQTPDPTTDPLDLERLEYNDPNVLDLFARGETAGVFQFESGGMRNLLMAMKPDRLEDLIAANALYRPGPMELIPSYNNRKHGREDVPSVHPIVDKFTAETYGIMIYQEQVMQVVHELGGIPLRAAYSLIKAISKKKQKEIDKERPKFVEGAQEKGLTAKQAEDLFELILKFAGYGFNKSHSTGYAIVAYQTGYLKTYFPVHYMAALLTYESVSTDKVVEYIDECKRVMKPDGERGIEVKPPDVNLSEIAFTVVYDEGEPRDANHGHIRFGLSAVKGVGEKAIRAILEQREKDGPFTSLYDFCERVPLGAVNRTTIEALIKCGAFDEVHGIAQRAAMMAALDGAIQSGQRAAADRDAGQLNFFDAMAADEAAPGEAAAQAPEVQLPSVEPWSTQEQLRVEKEVLGFYVSSHPLDEHQDALGRFSTCDVSQAKQLAADVEVVIGGMLTRVRPTLVKRGRSAGSKMAMLTIDDGRNTMEAVAFSDVYAQCYHHLEPDRVVFLKGKIDRRREEPSIVVNQVVPIEQAAESLTETVKIVVQELKAGQEGSAFNGEFAKLRELLRQAASRANGKSADVMLQLHQDGKCVRLRLNGLRIGVDRELPASINHLLNRQQDDDAAGKAWCELIGPPKINPDHVSGDFLHRASSADSGAPESAKLNFSMQDDGGASIDRY